MPYRMHDFMHDFGKFASNPHIKHIAHKLTPITDALISKGTEKVQSLKTGGHVRGRKKGAPKLIKAHVGEYVLPVGIKPTKAQKTAVTKRKQAMKKTMC